MRHRAPRVEVAALLVPVAALVMVASSASPASSVSAGSDAASSSSGARQAQPVIVDPAAMQLLRAAAAAPRTTAYRGVQFVSAWTEHGAAALVVDVDHQPGTGTSVHTDGNAQFPPADTFVPAEAREPSIMSGDQTLSLLADSYDLSLGAEESVAGRRTSVVEATRPGTKQPAARFWIDQVSGLVLRREVYDGRGRTTRASAFVEVDIGAARAAQVPPRAGTAAVAAAGGATAWSEEIDRPQFAAMRAKGWPCPERLARTLTLVDARRGPAPGGDGRQRILHLSYSDGLSSVSLFEQRGRLDTEKLGNYRRVDYRHGTIYVRDGVPSRVMWSAGGMVFTVVADAPPRVVEQVVEALPSPDANGNAWGRVSRGMDRVASWFNPFA